MAFAYGTSSTGMIYTEVEYSVESVALAKEAAEKEGIAIKIGYYCNEENTMILKLKSDIRVRAFEVMFFDFPNPHYVTPIGRYKEHEDLLSLALVVEDKDWFTKQKRNKTKFHFGLDKLM